MPGEQVALGDGKHNTCPFSGPGSRPTLNPSRQSSLPQRPSPGSPGILCACSAGRQVGCTRATLQRNSRHLLPMPRGDRRPRRVMTCGCAGHLPAPGASTAGRRGGPRDLGRHELGTRALPPPSLGSSLEGFLPPAAYIYSASDK